MSVGLKWEKDSGRVHFWLAVEPGIIHATVGVIGRPTAVVSTAVVLPYQMIALCTLSFSVPYILSLPSTNPHALQAAINKSKAKLKFRLRS